jgi:hypothetical protein
MAFARGLWPSEAAIARILDATGRKFVPAELDLSALRADLYRCRGEILAKQIDTQAYRKSHKKAADTISKQVRELRELLLSSGNGLFDRELWAALDPGDYELALGLLSRIESEAARIAKAGVDVQAAVGGPKEHLAKLLIPIYENRLGRAAGRDADSSGPFPRFVEAVGAAMGRRLRISKHTVHKSLANSRVGKKLVRRR